MKLFDMPALGIPEPNVQKVSFAKKFGHMRNHRNVEGFYDHGANTIFINTDFPAEGHEIAENHERIHHVLRHIGARDRGRYSKLIGLFSKDLTEEHKNKLGQYAAAGRSNPLDMTHDELYSEYLPQMYTMASSPWHRENYKKNFGGTDEELNHYTNQWNAIGRQFGVVPQKSDPSSRPPRRKIIRGVAKKEGDEEPPFEEQIKRVKRKYAEPKQQSFEDRVREIKRKYQEKIEKIGAVANAGPSGFAMSEDSKPVRKSANWAVAAGLQPSSEQWEAAAAQVLGLPTDRATADQLAKQAEAAWENSIANSFKSLSQPVEKVGQKEWGTRGPVDQSDDSQLTDEERRIRSLRVDPSLLKD